jgi:diguanylate cyclase
MVICGERSRRAIPTLEDCDMSQSPTTTEREFADRATPTAESPMNATTSELAFDVAIGDWDDLLSAVKSRLGSTAGELLEAATRPPHDPRAGRSQASVLECVSALDQLQTTLRHELTRRGLLEQELTDLKVTLAQARRELLGTQAGERQARHLALHDGLTALPNRTYFHERLAHALSRDEPPGLALLYFDLDDFKPINDMHGHDTGDALLKIVATRLARAVRAGDMVSRVGGDEFACLVGRLPNRQQLSRLAGKLLDAVAAPAQIGALMLSVRPSIGIVTSDGDGDGASADALLKNADAAMYRAKREKTGYAFFDPAVDVWAATVT